MIKTQVMPQKFIEQYSISFRLLFYIHVIERKFNITKVLYFSKFGIATLLWFSCPWLNLLWSHVSKSLYISASIVISFQSRIKITFRIELV